MNINQYKVPEKAKIHLKDYATTYDGPLEKKEVKSKLLPENLNAMAELQDALYAENTRGIVVVLQAMDAAGKDGLIKHVFTALNPKA